MQFLVLPCNGITLSLILTPKIYVFKKMMQQGKLGKRVESFAQIKSQIALPSNSITLSLT